MANIPGTDDNDILRGAADGDVITGGLGWDTLHGEGGDDVLSGGFNNDVLDGGAGRDVMNGASGADEFWATTSDRIIGGTGNDRFRFSQPAGADGGAVDGGLGFDRLVVEYWGGQGIVFAAQDPLVSIEIAGGIRIVNVESYEILGSSSVDRLTGGRWSDVLNGQRGDDVISGGGGWDVLEGGDGEDTLLGQEGDDQIRGDAGNDRLFGGDGSDKSYGGEGNDSISGDAGDDRLEGNAGDDLIQGGGGDDFLFGDIGVDTLDGGSGNDEVLVVLGRGQDRLSGGDGKDILSVSDLAGVFDPTSGRLADGTTFSGFEAYSLVARDQIADDQWTGAGGDDFMRSAGGNDILVGGGGNDELDAGVGSDVVDGGEGNDKILVGAEGRDYVIAGAGVDTVEIDRNTSQDDLVFYVSQNIGRLNDGTVILDAEHFRIRSGAGNDLLKAGTVLSVDFSGEDGNDRLTGGKGDDSLDGGEGNDVLLGHDGNDRIKDYGDVSTIDAGSGNDTVEVFAGGGNTLNPGLLGAVSGLISIQLGSGNDVVGLNRRESSKERSPSLQDGVLGRFAVDGGSGFDVAMIDRSDATVNLSFVLSANAVLTNGDVALKNVEAVQIWSGSGADSLTGGAYSDFFDGGEGNDTLKGLGGNDTLHGGFGADRLEGGDGNDMLRAAVEDNPDTHADRLYGGAGHDRLFIGQGDFADGGTEVDHIAIDLSDQAVGVSFAFTNGLVRVNAATSFTGAESLEFQGTSVGDSVAGGGLGDVLYGNNGNDTLRGGAGNDVLDDGAGNDKMYGDAGNDVLIRSAVLGTDIIDGGEGIDTLRFSLDAARSVILDLANNANNGGAAKGLVVAGVEIVHGSNIDDDIRGTTANETFLGGDGDDFLSGGAGDDILAGGEEGDLLVGGAGKDQFVFREDGRGTGDQVSDFTRGQDKLVIGRLDFGIAVSATPGLIVAADPRASGTGPQFLFETDNGRLWFDRDGAGGVHEAQLIVTLAGDNGHVPALALGDFLFV